MTRVFVVEVSPTVADDGSTATYLFSTHAFATRPTDTPPNTPVRALLKNAGTVRRELFSGARVTGAITPSYGNITLANPAPVDGAEGELDAWLAYGISGSRVIVRWGHLGDAYPAAWTTVYIAYAHSMIADFDAITIRLRDRLQILDKPVISDVFAGTGGIEGIGNVSKKKQFVSSDPGFIEPVLVDANQLIYFLQSTGDGSLRDLYKSAAATVHPFDVFDQGVKLTRSASNYATAADLLAAPPASGEVKYWFGPQSTLWPASTNGPVYFRLGSPPAGDLRCYAHGYPTDRDHIALGAPLGSFTAAHMAARAGVDSASILSAGMSIGQQLVADDSTFLDVLSDVALAQCGWFGFDRLDKFRSGYLLDPDSDSYSYGITYVPIPAQPSVSVYTFDGRNISGLRREPPAGMEAPVWKVLFDIGQTWPSEVAGSATPQLRDYLKRNPYWVSFQGVSTKSIVANPGAIVSSVQVKGRYITTQPQAIVLAQRYLSRYGGRRDFWTFSVPMADDVLALDLHDCVTLQATRFGLSAGRKHRIVGITLDCAAKVPQIRFTLWGGEAGEWTGNSGGPGTENWNTGPGGPPTAPLLMRNAIGDFTGWMAGSVSTASATGGGGGSMGDFTGYMRGGSVGIEAQPWYEITLLNRTHSSIAFGNGRFVIGDISGANATAQWSSDYGSTWNAAATAFPGFGYSLRLCFGDGLFFADVNSADSAYSADGDTWTVIPAGGVSGSSPPWFGNGIFFVVNGTSFNTWTLAGSWGAVRSTGLSSDYSGQGGAYGLGLYVMCGLGGSCWSSDLVTWTAGAVTGGAWTGSSLANIAFGNGTFVALPVQSGTQNKYSYSTDGKNWTVADLPLNRVWFKVLFSNGKFLACARNFGSEDCSILAYSSDGISWTATTPPAVFTWTTGFTHLAADEANHYVAMSIYSTTFGNKSAPG